MTVDEARRKLYYLSQLSRLGSCEVTLEGSDIEAIAVLRNFSKEAETIEQRLRDVLLDTGASLVAAVSLLENGGREAAASDRMFKLMVEDYKKSIKRFRDTLSDEDRAISKSSWPPMPDKFYEGLGWMHGECCAALDRGEDPRQFEVSGMVERCIHDLTRDKEDKGDGFSD